MSNSFRTPFTLQQRKLSCVMKCVLNHTYHRPPECWGAQWSQDSALPQDHSYGSTHKKTVSNSKAKRQDKALQNSGEEATIGKEWQLFTIKLSRVWYRAQQRERPTCMVFLIGEPTCRSTAIGNAVVMGFHNNQAGLAHAPSFYSTDNNRCSPPTF